MAITTEQILNQVSEQFAALTSLVRQLIVARSDDQTSISSLTSKANEYLAKYNESVLLVNNLEVANNQLENSNSELVTENIDLSASQINSLNIAESLKFELSALLEEAAVAIASKPVEVSEVVTDIPEIDFGVPLIPIENVVEPIPTTGDVESDETEENFLSEEFI